MVFYFTSTVVDPPVTLFMGEDKHENEALIRWGWPEDVWFHVDKLSSAHVYLRLKEGETIVDIPTVVLEEAAQLVKANSIQGNKMNDIDVVYTMWSNLHKTDGMEVGQVGFHKASEVKKIRVSKRENVIINRLTKTKREVKNPDLRAERETRDSLERDARKKAFKEMEEQKKIEERWLEGCPLTVLPRCLLRYRLVTDVLTCTLGESKHMTKLTLVLVVFFALGAESAHLVSLPKKARTATSSHVFPTPDRVNFLLEESEPQKEALDATTAATTTAASAVTKLEADVEAEIPEVASVVQDTTKFVIGNLLILLAVPALWIYERQRARVDVLLTNGYMSCRAISGEKVNADNTGNLVFLQNVDMKPTEEIQDAMFQLDLPKESCVRLERVVEVFASVEKTSFGVNGVSNWSHQWTKGDVRMDPSFPVELPEGIEIGMDVINSPHVEAGCFELPDGLVEKCNDFRSASHLLRDEIVTWCGEHRFKRHLDGLYYYRPTTEEPPGRTSPRFRSPPAPLWTSEQVAKAPKLGDVRVRFCFVPPGPVTILALQDAPTDAKTGFVPYRLVPLAWCGRNEKEQRDLQVAEGRKDRRVLAKEGQFLAGCRSRLCVGFNLLAGLCAGVHTPEILRCFEGSKSLDECFQDVREKAFSYISMSTWACRALAWSAIFVGLMLSISQAVYNPPFNRWPVVVILNGMGFPRTGSCVLLTASVAALMVSFAYLSYRLLMFFWWLFLAAAVVLLPNVLPHQNIAASPPAAVFQSLVQMATMMNNPGSNLHRRPMALRSWPPLRPPA